MNECINCDRPCFYTRCSQCQNAYEYENEREAKAIARAEEWEV